MADHTEPRMNRKGKRSRMLRNYRRALAWKARK